MSFLSFVIFVEIGISIMLFLFGYQGAIFGSLLTAFSHAAGVSVPNVTAINQTGEISGSQSNFSQSSLTNNGMFFNIFTAVLIAGVAFGVTGIFGGNFSAMYAIPALMIMLLLWVIISPIISVINLIILDSTFAVLGWILWLVFLALNVWGCISFIRGSSE